MIRSVHGFFFPAGPDDFDLAELCPSLVHLARTTKSYDYVVGFIERNQPRFMDVYCYTDAESCYETYWSALESTLTQSEWEAMDSD